MSETFQPGVIGKGTTIGYNTAGAPTVYTVLANVFDTSDPKGNVAHVETTTYASTDKEFIPGLTDNGTLELKLNYAQASQVIIYGLVGKMNGWQITKADGSLLEFEGFIESISGTNPIDNRVESMVGIKVSGTVSYTPMVSGTLGTPVTI